MCDAVACGVEGSGDGLLLLFHNAHLRQDRLHHPEPAMLMDGSRGSPERLLPFRQPPSFSIEAHLLSTRSQVLPSNEPEALNAPILLYSCKCERKAKTA